MLKPYHYLLVTLASASVTVACQLPQPTKAPLTTKAVDTNGSAPGGAATGGAGAATGGAATGTAGGPAASQPGTTTGSTPANQPAAQPPATQPAVQPPATQPAAQPPAAAPATGSSGGSTSGGGSSLASHPCFVGNPTQIERLARPAVNEGLLYTNSLLNTFNAVPPTVDLTTDATAIQTEVFTVLEAIGNNADRRNAIATAFLPDVMRYNSAIASGYASGAVNITVGAATVVRPVGGRLITDDTGDITLSVLVEPTLQAAIDNDGNAGTIGGTQGLHSDFVDYDDWHRSPTKQFPYLVPPN